MVSIRDTVTEALGTKSPDEIRNICLIAHVDHGKTCFADSLVSTNAIISGNVIFSSAIHCYAFGVDDFADMYAEKLKIPKQELSKALFGDFYISGGKIKEDAASRGKKALFVQLVLEPLWALHDCGLVIQGFMLENIENNSTESIEEVEAALSFDPVKGNVIFSSAIHCYAFGVDDFADMYAEKLKIPKLELSKALFGDFYISGGNIKEDAASRGKKTLFVQLVLEPLWALHDCGLVTNDFPKLVELFGPTVALVVKFVRFEDRKLAICRIFSGQIAAGATLYVLGRKARKDGSDPPKAIVDSVWALRGRDLIPLEKATAGVICAVDAQGLIQWAIVSYLHEYRQCILLLSLTKLYQNSTLCSEAVSEGLDVGLKQGEPLVRVSVNTANLEDMDRLKEDLKVLSVLDPSLRVLELDNGELAMITAGEVHLQKCLKDLEDLGFTDLEVLELDNGELAMITAGEVHLQKCLKDLEDLGFTDLEVSKPIVPFLETIVPDTQLTLAQILDQVTV
ncbi:hypothetical protein TELCIR_07796 [Teladorsagia circumcincta]|uniref:Uncharacterized protein n=1 Tax=Teladorsagia circumcincta TaxID=45464 RepID=A0A2G9UJE8_TELCI|nr:hypothetical protein TELCIR_07796 [Teladorsagia circumcincta]